ncbi:methyltransferase domain-containing protein [Actinomadura rayongensis]|uniref:Methyltransferase domain-containing protein n=1 Tax=Actinomadura rayongensis TaxID=1429076 RepID=A0A6I4WF99_9ACTN|nr:methyltransferase domain-containing protein [Actinomadura rayongensis]MXQ67560.1 methyltransferase domain-containing protein [Actinomadura rayongensis]
MLASLYGPLVAVLTLGRAGSLRAATLAAAGVGPGDDVLDVGCATGQLTGAARAAVGEDARVTGLDASAAMLDRARARTGRAEFVQGEAQRLPFPTASFDVVVLSLVLHYLDREQAAAALAEARRVLRPGGRAVVVDFARAGSAAGHVRAHLMLHGRAAATAPDHAALLTASGLTDVRAAPCPVKALAITRGTAER